MRRLVVVLTMVLYCGVSFAADLELGTMLFGKKPTHDLYESKGPKWKSKLVDENWVHEEDVTKMYDEYENIYDAVLSCQENEGKTTEGLELDDTEYELNYTFKAVKEIKAVKDYRAKKRKSRPKTLAYVLVPVVTISFDTDDTPGGVCDVEHDELGYVYANNKKKVSYLGRITEEGFEPAPKTKAKKS